MNVKINKGYAKQRNLFLNVDSQTEKYRIKVLAYRYLKDEKLKFIKF